MNISLPYRKRWKRNQTINLLRERKERERERKKGALPSDTSCWSCPRFLTRHSLSTLCWMLSIISWLEYTMYMCVFKGERERERKRDERDRMKCVVIRGCVVQGSWKSLLQEKEWDVTLRVKIVKRERENNSEERGRENNSEEREGENNSEKREMEESWSEVVVKVSRKSYNFLFPHHFCSIPVHASSSLSRWRYLFLICIPLKDSSTHSLSHSLSLSFSPDVSQK